MTKTTAYIKKSIEDLDLECHPEWVNSRFAATVLKVLESGKKFVARSATSTGIGRYWEVLCDAIPGSLIYANSDHDNPGEDAKRDCEKLNRFLSGRRKERDNHDQDR